LAKTVFAFAFFLTCE